MCGIIGAILKNINDDSSRNFVNKILEYIWEKSHLRGRDGRGYSFKTSRFPNPFIEKDTTPFSRSILRAPQISPLEHDAIILGNLRAEPTTEFVKIKKSRDQQPYNLNGWTIVHNGTIANDKDIRTYALSTTIDSAAIVEILCSCKPTNEDFSFAIQKLKGSFAILATHDSEPDYIYIAANYRPIWYAKTEYGIFFASSFDFFPYYLHPIMFQPYNIAVFSYFGIFYKESLYKKQSAIEKALVVCSGGLDSVVSATYAQKILGYQIHLIHFLYGSNAQSPEVNAIKNIANFLDCEYTLFPLDIYSSSDSPLLDCNAQISDAESGAEYAHEWIPSRNLVMLSVATSFAETRNMSIIILGNNLEEAGAYPDNEPEFVYKFNSILPFAIEDGKQIRVEIPVGNLMKHEIVRLGMEIDAPMNLTWSCYKNGELHCGTCGPCYMRRKAFEMNRIPEVIQYKEQ